MTAQCPCCGANITARDGIANELPPTQAAIYRAMARDFGQYVKTQRIASRAWASDPDGGPEFAAVCISSAVRLMRPKLALAGIVVESKQWLGYRVRDAA